MADFKLYLDDDHEGRPTPPGWARAYDVDEAIRILQAHNGPFEVSFDHDLGEDANGREKPPGTALVRWMGQNNRFPEATYIHTANPVGRKNLEFDLANLDRFREHTAKTVYAHWNDVFAKAKRLKDAGNVIVQRNAYEDVQAMVRGDFGVYEVRFNRQDPASRAITMWSCTCPWAQFVWFRTGPWRKYEGRVCSHTLAAYWAAKGVPLDDDAMQDWSDRNDFAQKIKGDPFKTEQPDDGVPEGPGAEMLDDMLEGPDEDLPDELDDLMPSALPIEPDLSEGPLPKQPPLPFAQQGELVGPESDKGELTQPNAIQQGLMDMQKNLGEDTTNFLKKQYPQFFKIPGTLSHVAAGGDDFEIIWNMLYPPPGKTGQKPTAEMLEPEWGEYRGGIDPHPEAKPIRLRQDKSPIYNLDDMGWNGTEMVTEDRAHACDERRGDYGEIPALARVSILDADKTMKWVKVSWPVRDTSYCQARSMEAWVDAKKVKLVGSERLRPDIERKDGYPEDDQMQKDWTAQPVDDWA